MPWGMFIRLMISGGVHFEVVVEGEDGFYIVGVSGGNLW
jgi:hypothetical protein